MKGVAAIALVLACGIAMANPPLPEPIQYEQFCEHQLVSGNGTMWMENIIIDRRIALNYRETMTNYDELDPQKTAHIEIDSTRLYSQKPLNQTLPCDPDKNQSLNFYENTKMAFDGVAMSSTLAGEKYLESKGLYGGINAMIQEIFDVQLLEKDQKAFFGSTNNSTITHTVGLDTANAFNGTWGTNANMHKIFYKDVNTQERFEGTFEIKKSIKLHESPIIPYVPDEERPR